MDENKVSYQETLSALTNTGMNQLVASLSKSNQLEALLEDILNENTEHLRPWLTRDQPAWKIVNYSTTDLAFDFLSAQPKEWLDNYYLVFEKILVEQQEKNTLGTPRLNALIAATGACVRTSMLEIILDSEKLNLNQELEAYLLIAKIKEKENRLDPEAIVTTMPPEDYPHLLPYYVYIYREKDQMKGLELLVNFLENKKERVKNQINQGFLATYLRQTIYNYLHKGGRWEYMEFLSLKGQLTHEWILELMEDVMDHPALEAIKKTCHEIREELTAPKEADIKQKLKNFEDEDWESN